MCLWCQQLGQRYQTGTHGHGVAVECSQMQHFLMVDVAHDVCPSTKGSDGHAAADGFGKADEVWLHRIEFGDAPRSHCYPCFHFVKDEQGTMATGEITYTLEIVRLRQYDTDIHQHRFGDDGGHFTFMLAQDTL